MEFVWVNGVPRYNTEVCFVTDVTRRKNVTVELVGADVYNVYVNGKYVHYGPARAAKGYARLDVLDITPFLTQERNALAVCVIDYGVSALSFVRGEPFFGADVYADGELLATTGDFDAYRMTDRLRKVQRISFQRGFAEAYAEDGFRQRALLHLLPDDLKLPHRIEQRKRVKERGAPYPDRRIHAAKLLAEGAVSLREQPREWLTHLFTQELYNVFAPEEYDVAVHRVPENLIYQPGSSGKGGAYALFGLERVTTGKIAVEVEAAEDTELYLLYDELLEDGVVNYRRTSCLQAVYYRLKKGRYRLVTSEVYTFRYLNAVAVGGRAKVAGAACISAENPDAGNFCFTCADREIERVVLAAKHTFRQNALDILMDCPSRERAGWLCDSWFTARAERLFTGKNRVERAFLENYALAPQVANIPDAVFPMCYPGEHADGVYIPNWAMWLISELDDYVDRTGDSGMLRRFRRKVYAFLEFMLRYENEFGLLEDVENWLFLEWSRANDYVDGVNLPTNMHFCRCLEIAGRLYEDRALLQRASELRQSIERFFAPDPFFHDHAVRKNGVLTVAPERSETCQYYAFCLGFADRERNDSLFRLLTEHFGAKRDAARVYPEICKSNAFIGNYLRYEMLRQNGDYRLILDESAATFGYMAERTGTLWELASPTASCAHGFASYAGNLLVEAACGYRGFDAARKEIYLSKKAIFLDCSLTLPLDGQCVTLTVSGGIPRVEGAGWKLVSE